MVNKKTLYKVSFFLVILGAINLGIYGLTAYDVIDYIFAGDLEVIAQIIDTLIGAAGIYLLYRYYSGEKISSK